MYWTLSPRVNGSSEIATVIYMPKPGTINNLAVSTTEIAIAPVINISAEYAAQLTGSGTMTSPYQILNIA